MQKIILFLMFVMSSSLSKAMQGINEDVKKELEVIFLLKKCIGILENINEKNELEAKFEAEEAAANLFQDQSPCGSNRRLPDSYYDETQKTLQYNNFWWERR